MCERFYETTIVVTGCHPTGRIKADIPFWHLPSSVFFQEDGIEDEDLRRAVLEGTVRELDVWATVNVDRAEDVKMTGFKASSGEARQWERAATRRCL